jgi:ankyrin repeat protein
METALPKVQYSDVTPGLYMSTKAERKKAASKFGARELGMLIKACFKGDIAFAERSLRLGVDPNSLHKTSGSRPLTAASDSGRLSIVRLLLDAGADPNLQDTWKSMPPKGTALEVACSRGHLEITKLLVERRADVNKAGYWPPLKSACSYGRAAIVRYLLSQGAGWEPSYVLLAARSTSVETLRELVSVGAAVNYQTSDGETPLHLAAVQKSPSMAEALIKAGAKLNVQCKRWKETPLHRAAARGRAEVVKVLLQAGADLTLRNCKGKTAEQWARALQQKTVADLIRSYSKG